MLFFFPKNTTFVDDGKIEMSLANDTIVTFDSNVEYLPKATSRKIHVPTKNWCFRVNDCTTDLRNKQIKFYYNTPISMTDDKFEDNTDLVRQANSSIFTNFVYIDEAINNQAAARIKNNFTKLNNRVIQITRNSPVDYGHYNIKNSKNYPDHLIVSFIAKIINFYIESGGKLLDPNTWLSTNDNSQLHATNDRFITYNLNSSMDRYIGATKIKNDCVVCKL